MEQVVLLDEQGRPAGVADKATVHGEATPLHLAFSCYVFNGRGQLLLTRRARTKRTWPGVWTNSCCGHPAPDESLAGAVTRRLHDELGLSASAPELVLPRFRYRAVMGNGVVENEMCPVFRARSDAAPAPEPAEVEDFGWLDWPLAVGLVSSGALDVSPWCADQLAQLATLGDDPLRWPLGDRAELPSAAHV